MFPLLDRSEMTAHLLPARRSVIGRPWLEWDQIWYHGEVNAAVLLQEARRRSGLSRRQLAERGGTSASTLSAYESGASVPSVVTLSRLLRAAGFEAEANLRPAPAMNERELAEKIEALFSSMSAQSLRRLKKVLKTARSLQPRKGSFLLTS